MGWVKFIFNFSPDCKLSVWHCNSIRNTLNQIIKTFMHRNLLMQTCCTTANSYRVWFPWKMNIALYIRPVWKDLSYDPSVVARMPRMTPGLCIWTMPTHIIVYVFSPLWSILCLWLLNKLVPQTQDLSISLLWPGHTSNTNDIHKVCFSSVCNKISLYSV